MRRIVELLERAFRHGITYPLLRLVFHNPVKNSPMKLESITKLLILRYDRIGDMIVTTPIFRNLKRLNPGLHIGVFASQTNAEILRYDPHVDSVYVLRSNWFRLLAELRRARREKYEVVLNFVFNRTTSGGILANLIAPKAHKVGQGDEKYQFYFNRLLALDRSSAHLVETLGNILNKVFGIELTEEDLEFQIVIDEDSHKRVDAFLAEERLRRKTEQAGECLPYVVFNLSATNPVTKISVRQANELALHLSQDRRIRIVAVHAPGDVEMKRVLSSLVRDRRCVQFPEEGTASLLEIASLIEGALAVITPDTSIIHFASATKTPVLGFFTPLQEMHEWLPFRVASHLVNASGDQPVSAIPISKMIQGVDQFLAPLFADMTSSRRVEQT